MSVSVSLEDLRKSVAQGRKDVARGAMRRDVDVEAFFRAKREAVHHGAQNNIRTGR